MGDKQWLFDIYQIVGAFFFTLVAYALLQVGATLLKNKILGRKNGNGDGAERAKSNGVIEGKLDEIIVEMKKVTGNTKIMAAVIGAIDESGMPKVHNKPEVERMIRETHDAVTRRKRG